jgi:hypothetical protein
MRSHHCGEKNHQSAECIGIEEAICQRDSAAGKQLRGQRNGDEKNQAKAGEIDPFHLLATTRKVGRSGGGNGNQ